MNLLNISLFFLLLSRAFSVELEVRINHHHGSSPLIFHSLRYQTPSQESYSITRLSYLLSGVTLEDEKGKLSPLKGEFYIDAEKRPSFRLQEIPPAVYRALHFDLGLSKEDNLSDPAEHPANHPLNPLVNKLHWNKEGGYIFMALEGQYRSPQDKEISGFVYHIAREKNRTRLSISQKMDLRDSGNLLLSLDLHSLLSAPHSVSFTNDGRSTHSNPGDPLPKYILGNLKTALSPISFQNSANLSAARAKLKPLYIPTQFTPYKFVLPRNFSIPALPLDNPLIIERAELGKKLFHDTTLSQNGKVSCASCHIESQAFSDSQQFSIGLNGKQTPRHSMPLFNLAWKDHFFWDGRANSLRAQVLEPIEDPIEMHENLDTLPKKLMNSGYQQDFQKAFDSKEITTEKLSLALETFLLTLTSTNSKFDQALKGKAELSKQEQRGLELFYMEYEPKHGKRGADCFHCHGGALFSDFDFHDNGLGLGKDKGKGGVTGKAEDMGKFSTPSLRNIALTAPYMHDGRFQTLEEVVRHYSEGIKRTPNLSPNLAKHPTEGINLTKDDQAALVAFLKILTDPKYLKK